MNVGSNYSNLVDNYFYDKLNLLHYNPKIIPFIRWEEDTVTPQLDPDRLKVVEVKTELDQTFFDQSNEGVYISVKHLLSKAITLTSLINFVNRTPSDDAEVREKKSIVCKCIAMHLKHLPEHLSTFRRMTQLAGFVGVGFFESNKLRPFFNAIYNHDVLFHQSTSVLGALPLGILEDIVLTLNPVDFLSYLSSSKGNWITAHRKVKLRNKFDEIAFINHCLEEVYFRKNRYEEVADQAKVLLLLAEKGAIMKGAKSVSFLLEDVEIASKKIEDEETRSEIQCQIVSGLVKIGFLDEAMKTANEMCLKRDKVFALASIISDYGRKGNLELVRDTFQRSLEIVNEISDDIERAQALKAIASELSNGGFIKEAINITNHIDLEYQKNLALLHISIKQLESGFLKEAKKTVSSIQKKVAQSLGFAFIASEECRLGLIQDATQTLERIQSKTKKIVAQAMIATVQYEMGDVESAHEILSKALIRAMNWKPQVRSDEAFFAICIALALCEKFDEAIEASNHIGDDNHRNAILELISMQLAKRNFIRRATLLANQIQNKDSCAAAIAAIASELAQKNGFFPKACDTFDDAIFNVDSRNDSMTNANIVSSVVSSIFSVFERKPFNWTSVLVPRFTV